MLVKIADRTETTKIVFQDEPFADVAHRRYVSIWSLNFKIDLISLISDQYLTRIYENYLKTLNSRDREQQFGMHVSQ